MQYNYVKQMEELELPDENNITEQDIKFAKISLMFKCLDKIITESERQFYFKHCASDIERKKNKMYPELNINDQAEIDVVNGNNRQGELSGYDCPKCKNRGIIYKIGMKDGHKVAEEVDCDCNKIRSILKCFEVAGITELVKKYKFENYKTENLWQNEIVRKAKNYVNRTDNAWFTFLGQSGSGKSHICISICRELVINGYQVKYYNWVGYIAYLKDLKINYYDEYLDEIEYLKDIQVLYIDDLFKKDRLTPLNAMDIEIAYDIINARYNKSMTSKERYSTIITSEKTPKELIEIDEAIAGRIIELSQPDNLTIAFGLDKNYRLKGLI